MKNKNHIYKLLIADDEYWIREQLRILIDWKSYSIEFLEPACDGEEVLARIKSQQPDIVITDINMPFVNGVDLLKEINANYPNIITAIISGYNDFEYVKEGLLTGALDYILKPISKMELVKTITKALDIINENRMNCEKEKYERIQLLRATSALMDRELSEVVTREAYQSGTQDIIRHAALNTDGRASDGFYLYLVRIHNVNAMADIFDYDINLLSYSIKQQLKEKLKDRILFLFNNVYLPSEFILVMNTPPDELSEQAYSILLTLKEFTNKVITIGTSERHYGEAEFRKAYEEARMAVVSRTISPSSKVILFKEINQQKAKESRISSKQEEQLVRMLKDNIPACKKFVFNSMGVENCIKEEWTILEIKKVLQRVLNIIEAYLRKEAKEEYDLQNMADSLLHFAEDNNFEAMMSTLNDYLDMALQVDSEIGVYFSGKETIRAVVDYIDECFYEEITLSNLSEKYHIESSYLSKLFKKETGYNLIYHLARKRIEKARELIGENNLSLTEISFSVGYDDYNYFNKVFRKLEGISPREYRSNFTGKF